MIVASIPQSQNHDICIVGAGPVGLSAAFECEKLGMRVLLLEAGNRVPSAASSEDSHAEIANPRRHAPMEIAVSRAIGGTSWLWGGRCVPYDEIDFEDRPHLPNSVWPISHSEIQPHYPAACHYLACGDAFFEQAPKRFSSLLPSASASHLERWSTESRLGLIHTHTLAGSSRITVIENCTAVDIAFNESSSAVVGLIVSLRGNEYKISAAKVILAAGGVETTRLLLAVQRSKPAAFGGVDGPLGRYYMGHISGKIATVTFKDPAIADDLDFYLDPSGTYTRRRLTLSPETQQRNRLLNTVFWPDNPPFYDPKHRSGVLSAVFLALATPPVGRRILPEAIRLAHTGPKPFKFSQHFRNVLFDAPSSISDIANILKYRFISKPRKPGFLIRNKAGRYALHYHAEQEPDSESRITLTNEKDRFGLPRARIDLRYSSKDIDSVIRSHRILDAALRQSAVGQLDFNYPESELYARVDEQACDGFHQVGTTRMGTDADKSVVDRNLKVHGLENLYLASSSVFPSSGQANSTFLAAALAIRLAHHLASQMQTPNNHTAQVQLAAAAQQ